MRISDWSSDVCSSDLDGRIVDDDDGDVAILFHRDGNRGIFGHGRLLQINPLASSEVEMPLGLGARSMGVSTSLDTNGKVVLHFSRRSRRGQRSCPRAARGSDRKSVVEGKSGVVRVDSGGGGII